MKKMFENMIERMKANFVPTIDDQARLAIDGTVCVRTNTANGKEWLGVKSGEMVAYPEEMLLEDVPVYTIAKPLSQIKVGDIVKATSSTYARVEKVKDGKMYSVTFGGNVRKNIPIKDFLTQQETFRIVVNPFEFSGNQGMNNNMMLLTLLDKEDNGNIAELMMLASMMSGQGQTNPFGNIMNNPIALMTLAGKGGGSIKEIMMLQMFQNGGFNMCVTPKAEESETKIQAVETPDNEIVK